MTDLSPAAYAVLSAVAQDEYTLDPEDIPQLAASIRSHAAVALRAAADQVVPGDGSRHANEIRSEFLAIADELEAQ